MTGLEAFIAAASEPFIKAIVTTVTTGGIKFVGKEGSNLLDRAGNLTQDARSLFRPIAHKYIKNYKERHGILKVLGMRESVDLDDVYVSVQLLNPEDLKAFESVDNLEDLYRQSKTRTFQSRDLEKKPGIDIANEQQYLMVLGGPGMGKSTFLRKVGLEALKGKREESYKHTAIPVFIELKRFREGEINLEEALAEEFKNCGLPQYEECTSKLLDEGRLLLLFDGLDEVLTERMSDMVINIQDFVDRYNQNRFITSCRTASYHNFRRFYDVAIADFDDKEIENFVSNWFGEERAEMAKECQQKLNSGDFTSVKELAQNPLLLTLFCLVYQRGGQFPTKRATLYEKALLVLLEEWNAAKEIPKQYLGYKKLDTKAKELILSEIAYENFFQNRLFFQRRDLIAQIEKLLPEMLADDSSVNGADVIRDIEVQHGILVERAESIYSFSHLTFQEFLTAQYIYEDLDGIKQIIKDYLCEPRWREIFLLIGGLKNRADNLLLAMEQQIKTYINTPKLQGLLVWAEQIIDTYPTDIKSVAKKGIACSFALGYANDAKTIYSPNTIYAAKTFVNTADYRPAKAAANAANFAKVFDVANTAVKAAYCGSANAADYIREIKELKVYKNIDFNDLLDKLEKLKEQIPDKNLPKEIYLDLVNKIIQTMLEGFHLTREMIDFSQEEFICLENYFYANKLMIDCKEAAVRVSQKTWDGIEERMFLPTNRGS